MRKFQSLIGITPENLSKISEIAISANKNQNTSNI